jgi:hypothetical protein
VENDSFYVVMHLMEARPTAKCAWELLDVTNLMEITALAIGQLEL